jgi:hypothetical protein
MMTLVMRAMHVVVAAVLGAGLGVQVFLSFLLAPATFRLLDRPAAAHLMEGVFPGYYGFGLATTGIALVLALALARHDGGALRWAVAILLVAALAGTVYAGSVLLPRAHAARLRAQAAPAGDLAPREFARLHGLAMAVNVALLGVGLLTLGLHVGVTRR